MTFKTSDGPTMFQVLQLAVVAPLVSLSSVGLIYDVVFQMVGTDAPNLSDIFGGVGVAWNHRIFILTTLFAFMFFSSIIIVVRLDGLRGLELFRA